MKRLFNEKRVKFAIKERREMNCNEKDPLKRIANKQTNQEDEVQLRML